MANTAPKKASREDWHPADIKAALEKKGWTILGLARHHGLKGSSALSHTFERSYPANEKRIADALGVLPQDIWPSRYNADGSKKPRGLRGAIAAKCTPQNCQSNGNEAAGC